MPLQLYAQKRFFSRSGRVKGLDFRPTEPWLLAGLYMMSTAWVNIYNHETEAIVKTFLWLSYIRLLCKFHYPFCLVLVVVFTVTGIGVWVPKLQGILEVATKIILSSIVKTLPGVSEDLWMAQAFAIGSWWWRYCVSNWEVVNQLTPEWAAARQVIVPPILWENEVVSLLQPFVPNIIRLCDYWPYYSHSSHQVRYYAKTSIAVHSLKSGTFSESWLDFDASRSPSAVWRLGRFPGSANLMESIWSGVRKSFFVLSHKLLVAVSL